MAAPTTQDFKVIGTRPVRHDGLDKVIGRAKYGADYSFPGMLYGKVLRSPHAMTNYRRTAEPDASMREITPDQVFEALVPILAAHKDR